MKGFISGNNEWHRSKLMELRDVLRQDKAHQQYFITETAAGGLHLPEYEAHSYHATLWENKKTPYTVALQAKKSDKKES